MISFNWPIIIVTSAVLYGLIIITLPFSPVTATILLFSLIAFWSKLPGCCIYEPIRLMYMMDFVDIFSVIIAIYVGPMQGAFFALMWNIYPRLAGAYLPWLSYIKDGSIQAFLCLFVPLMFVATGNLLTVVVIFSILRIIIYTIVSLFLPTRSIIDHIIQATIAGITGLIINSFYAKIFGDFFSNLLKQGATFSWPLFLVASGIILGFSMLVFGFSPLLVGKNAAKNVTKIVKHQIRKNAAKKNSDDNEELAYFKQIKDDINSK